AIARTGAKFVDLDPILAFLDSTVHIASDQSVRQALQPLSELADRRRCAIKMTRHLNKTGTGRALYRGLYSIGFIASCCAAWLVGRDPTEPRQYVLANTRPTRIRRSRAWPIASKPTTRRSDDRMARDQPA